MKILPIFSLFLSLFIFGCSDLDQNPNEPKSPTEGVQEVTTYLNDRFVADSASDAYCFQVPVTSAEVDWASVEDFLDGHFYGDAPNLLASIQGSLEENPERRLSSLCRYGEELFASELQGSGEEFQGYRIYIAKGEGEVFEVSSLMIPYGRTVSLSTVLFEDALGVAARAEGEALTDWYYFKIDAESNSVEQVEWCEVQESVMNCEYQYEPGSAL